jgi:hypothetical protein
MDGIRVLNFLLLIKIPSDIFNVKKAFAADSEVFTLGSLTRRIQRIFIGFQKSGMLSPAA